MKKPLALFLALITLPLLLTSCLDKDQDDNAEPTSLLKKWELSVIDYSNKTDLAPPQDEEVWIVFEKQQPTTGNASGYRYNGKAAPNYYFGGVNLTSEGTNGGMELGEMFMTEIGSTKIANTEFEIEYLGLLRLAKTYAIQNNTLVITCRDGEKLVYNSSQSN